MRKLNIFLLVFTSCVVQQTWCKLDEFPSICNDDNKCICGENPSLNSNPPEVTVDCSGSTFKNIPADNYAFVSILDFTSNSIEGLDNSNGSLLESDSLRVIKYSHNEIGFISDKYFALLPNLEELYLDHNQLPTLNTFAFDGLRKLKVLDLSFNKIKIFSEDIFKPLTSLTVLSLRNNDLKDHLMEVTKSDGIFGSYLSLTSNLTSLNLDNTGLSKLPSNFFGNENSLLTLSLADNAFANVPSIPLTVRHLDYSGNLIDVLAGRDLLYPALRTLKLERLKNFTAIDRYAFYNLANLEYLSLAYNYHLMEMPPDAFGVLLNDMNYTLKSISLKGCRLQTLHSNYSILFSSVESVDLTFNPWKCNCELEWIKNHRKILTNFDNIKCASPGRSMDKSFLSTGKATCDKNDPSTLQKILLPILSVLIITLVGLIAYLIYMGPFNYNRMGLSRNSPYRNILVNEE